MAAEAAELPCGYYPGNIRETVLEAFEAMTTLNEKALEAACNEFLARYDPAAPASRYAIAWAISAYLKDDGLLEENEKLHNALLDAKKHELYISADGLTEAIEGDVRELVRDLNRAADTLLSLAQENKNLKHDIARLDPLMPEGDVGEIVKWLMDKVPPEEEGGYRWKINGHHRAADTLLSQQREIERLRADLQELKGAGWAKLGASGAAQESGEDRGEKW